MFFGLYIGQYVWDFLNINGENCANLLDRFIEDMEKETTAFSQSTRTTHRVQTRAVSMAKIYEL